MSRIDLRVPYTEKDVAKRLGARWDPMKKVWYVPEGVNPYRFQKWLPQHYNLVSWSPTIWAQRFFIARTKRTCWSCKKDTPVYSFFLDQYEYMGIDENEDSELPFRWIRESFPTFAHYISKLNNTAIQAMNKYTDSYYIDKTKGHSDTYFVNHCKFCGSVQGDFYLHEDSGTFSPNSIEEIRQIQLFPADGVFTAIGSISYQSIFEDFNPIDLCLRSPTKPSWFRRLFKSKEPRS